MAAALQWRLLLAKKIAASYAHHPKAQVVMIAGSVGRGCADHYSDIEIDVYYTERPTVDERVAAVEGCGGSVLQFDEDEDEWEEQISFGGFHVGTSCFLTTTMERYLTEVIDQCQVAPQAQTRLYSLLHAVPIKGEELVEQWRSRAQAYPTGLTYAMLRHYLPFFGFWYAENMLAARDDRLQLYRIFLDISQQMLGVLLGLNRLYMPRPDFLRGADETIAALAIKPVDLSQRLKQAFCVAAPAGVQMLKALITETLRLIEQQVPEFDTSPYWANFAGRRPVWDEPPPGIMFSE